MGPQTFALIQGVLVFVAGILASRGIISQETVAYLGGADTLAFITTLGGAAVIGLAWWKTRPHNVVALAGKELEGKGAVIAPADFANSKSAPANVVDSIHEAAKLPGVSAGRG